MAEFFVAIATIIKNKSVAFMPINLVYTTVLQPSGDLPGVFFYV